MCTRALSAVHLAHYLRQSSGLSDPALEFPCNVETPQNTRLALDSEPESENATTQSSREDELLRSAPVPTYVKDRAMEMMSRVVF